MKYFKYYIFGLPTIKIAFQWSLPYLRKYFLLVLTYNSFRLGQRTTETSTASGGKRKDSRGDRKIERNCLPFPIPLYFKSWKAEELHRRNQTKKDERHYTNEVLTLLNHLKLLMNLWKALIFALDTEFKPSK